MGPGLQLSESGGGVPVTRGWPWAGRRRSAVVLPEGRLKDDAPVICRTLQGRYGREPQQRRAFTLLELLLSLVIVSLLLALVFPVFQSARRRSRMAICTARLRQLGLAYSLYVADYGRYPSPLQVVKQVDDRRVLQCPADVSRTPGQSASSYSFRSVLPPTWERYWELPDVHSQVVLAVCSHHLEQSIGRRGETRTLSAPRYPYKLALRAGGGVGQVHVNQIREIAAPGDRPTIARIYPGEPAYEQSLLTRTDLQADRDR